MARTPAKLDPLLDATPTQAEATALAAFYHGRANEDQQRLVRDFILQKACRAFSSTFNEDPHVSAFMQGRRQAGLIIMNATRTTAAAAQAVADQTTKENPHG